jgi:DNA mismatch repair protein MutS2
MSSNVKEWKLEKSTGSVEQIEYSSNARHLKVLDYDKILAMLAEYAEYFDTCGYISNIRPESCYEKAVKSIDITAEIFNLTNSYGFPAVTKMENCLKQLDKASLGSTLSLKELLNILAALRNMNSVYLWRKKTKKDILISDLFFDELYIEKSITEKLSNTIISDEEIDDNSSALLAGLRKSIKQAGINVRNRMESIIRSAAKQKMLQEPIITMRSNRYVVPVKAEYKNDFKGIVHDVSSSGATVFMEPAAAVELNNEIKLLEKKESEEQLRIIRELSKLVGQESQHIAKGYNAIIQLDILFAKAHLAKKQRASVPILLRKGETSLANARHPLIESEKVVPIDIAIGSEKSKILVITGPNTGGKTVAIKTLGLLVLMASSGLLIPADEGSRVTVYERVLADIGDEQSIEQSLSTFSGHMKNIVEIINEADESSLVLLDELGAGTDPVEGAALAVSILESLKEKQAVVAATTHYAEVKMYAFKTLGVTNAGCEFDINSLKPTYRLIIGMPGRSNAFLIGEKLGLPTQIIERAREKVSSDSIRFEDIISEIEEKRQRLEHEIKEIEAIKNESEKALSLIESEKQILEERKEKELESARRQARRLVEDTRVLSQVMIEDLEAVKKEHNAKKFTKLFEAVVRDAKGTLNELESLANPIIHSQERRPLQRPPKKGDSVFVYSLNKDGTVISEADGNNILVRIGALKTSVPLEDIRLNLENAPKQNRPEIGKSRFLRESEAPRKIMLELDIRGLDAIEAVFEVDKFLDNAVLNGINEVRIIHGKGTGRLRSAVGQHLRKHASVSSFRLGRYGEGEDGVTIAKLK